MSMLVNTDAAEVPPIFSGWRARIFPHLLAKANARYERWIAARKRELFGGLRGKLLEIGPGTGVNLRYYSGDVQWIGIEPNPYMQVHLRKEAKERGVQLDLRTGIAECMDVAGQSIDTVVGTLVLCSVADIDRVLKEIQRVLKPGGRYIFIEHVAAPRGTWLRRAQRVTRPVLKVFADGCQPDRETWTCIRSAGFREVRIEHFRAPLPVVSPHISGVAIR